MATAPNIRLLPSNATGTLTAQSTAFTVTPSATTTAGSLGLIQIWNSVSATTPDMTSFTGGGTWTRVANSSNGVTASELWFCPNMSAVSSVTGNPALAITGGWNFVEFSGILAVSPLDGSAATANTASASWSFTVGPTSTSTDNNHLVIECDAPQNGGKGGGGTIPSGFTNAQTGGSGATHGYINYRIRVASSTQTESATVSGSSASSSAVTAIICIFRPVATLIQQRQVVSNVGSTTATVVAPLVNSRILIQVSRAASGGTLAGASTITQTGTTYTRVGIIQGTGGTAEEWQSTPCTGSEGTTITFGNSCAYVVSEWVGLSTGTLTDQSATANTAGAAGGGPTTITSASITPTNGPQLVLCVLCGYINAKGGTWGATTGGFNSLASFTAGGQSINGTFKVIDTAAASSTSATLVTTLSTNTYPSLIASFFQTPVASGTGNLMLLGVGA